METLQTQKQTGITGDGLRAWGLTALAAGVAGKGIIQRTMLGLGTVTTTQLLELLDTSGNAMTLVTIALILQVVECCAVPVFAFLLTEGFAHTANAMGYLGRVLALAVVSEIPYDLVTQGSVFALSEQNPVFGVALGIITLYFFQRYPGKSWKNVAVKAIVLLAALAWASMLHIAYGGSLVFLAVVLWLLRGKSVMRPLAGGAAAMLCCLDSPFFLASPMVFLALRSYNGDQGDSGKGVRYGAYPAILLVIWGLSLVLG